MPFTEPQKAKFIALLQEKGWQLREGAIWSPSSGLYFSESHFNLWDPPQMREIFVQRSARIAKHEDSRSQESARENLHASWAAEVALKISE